MDVLSNPDLLVLIFSRLRTTTELGRAAQCCRLWRTSSASNDVWRPVVFAAFPATRGLIGVQSYKALHARMNGFDPKRVETTLDDYQFMIQLQYEGRTVLQATVQGSAAIKRESDEDDNDALEMHIPGESYDIPAWELDAEMDLSWLADTHVEQLDEDNLGTYEQCSADICSFLDAAYDEPEVGFKLELTVTAFRASDQRTAVLMKTGPDTGYDEDDPRITFMAMTQAMAYPGRHRRRTDTYPNFDKDGLTLMCDLGAFRDTDAVDPVRWDLAMNLVCDAVSDDGTNICERVGVPAAELLRYLEGASWV